ncbi:junctional sarcoplasmic reticulum protein 1 isoform X1 [Moschus berezovskii]|uniref:junctional sarcoplasmic reticulum protein 1 isoform X1 n=1 Tax=Moschus berezovskii TaxID=68408 RepID=UPI0024449788|nr:junctional sarcoplasmic reticulum protein 1 isoform X1 [Moschus berezovskii]
MATRALEELDGGLGSCQVDEDLSALADPCPGRPQEDRVRGTREATSRLADSSSRSHDSQERVTEGSPTGSVDTKPKKTEKEPVSKVTSGTGKERLKAGATPRSPARKKAQTAPPPQPPPPPPALSEELPWGDLTLNKCLVLASLLALLGSAFQLCREAVTGDAEAPAPVPELWASSSSSPKGPASPLPKPEAWVPPVRQPEPPLKVEERVQIPRSEEAAEKEEWESEDAADEEHAPLAGRRPKERLKKEKPRKERPWKEKPQKEERPRKEKPRKEEKPRGAREPRGALPRRWEAREGGHRPWGRDSGAPEDRKKQAWVSPRRPDEEDRPPGRQKSRAGKGRD